MLMRRAVMVWSLVAGVGLVLCAVGAVLQGQYDDATKPVVAPVWPPLGVTYIGEPNEVVYLSRDRTTYHRINCVHRTLDATQILVKNLPKGATPCATCIVPPNSVFNLDPPPHLLTVTRTTQWTGGLVLASGLVGLLVSAFNKLPVASRAPGFPLDRHGPE